MTTTSSNLAVDSEIDSLVLDVLSSAQRRAVLVMPYVEFGEGPKKAIQAAIARGVEVVAVCQLGIDSPDLNWLAKAGARTHAVKGLRTKVAMNESTVVVTSMNLYDYSRHSREIGVRLADPSDVGEVRRYVIRDLIGEVLEQVASPIEGLGAPTHLHRTRTCCDCGEEIAYHLYRPRCLSCFVKICIGRHASTARATSLQAA